MSVLLPNASLTAHVRAHPVTRDARGTPVYSGDPEVTRGPHPGSVREPDGQAGEGAPWTLRLDPAVGELRQGDLVSDGAGREWVVRSSNVITVPGHPDVDCVRALADLDPPKVP